MQLEESMMAAVEELEARYIMNTYNRQEDRTLVLVKGAGSRVWDNKGRTISILSAAWPLIFWATATLMWWRRFAFRPES